MARLSGIASNATNTTVGMAKEVRHAFTNMFVMLTLHLGFRMTPFVLKSSDGLEKSEIAV